MVEHIAADIAFQDGSRMVDMRPRYSVCSFAQHGCSRKCDWTESIVVDPDLHGLCVDVISADLGRYIEKIYATQIRTGDYQDDDDLHVSSVSVRNLDSSGV